MKHTREHVLRTFPELATPGHPDPHDPVRANEDVILDWIKYWDNLDAAITRSGNCD